MADKKYKLIFNLSDGSKQAVEFTAPQGPAGNGLDITGAVAGQTVKISAVDENGVPTAWEAVNISNTSQNTKEETVNIINESNPYLLLPSGSLKDATNASRVVTRYKGASAGETYLFTCSANYGNAAFVVYDSKGAALLAKVSPSTAEGTVLSGYKVTMPEKTAGYRLAANLDLQGAVEPSAVKIVQRESTFQVSPLLGKKWVCLGDSITEKNNRTTKNYHDYIAEETGITVVNMGVGGTGYMNGQNENLAFYQRAADIPSDADIVTIFGSGNDRNLTLGNVTDTDIDTVCGCINATLDRVQAIVPTAWVGVISPTPWMNFPPSDSGNKMALISDALGQICRMRGIPFLDLYRCSGLRPWDETFRTLAYSKDNGDGTHPDETGHAMIAPQVRAFLLGAIQVSCDSSRNGGGLTTTQINALQGMFQVCMLNGDKDAEAAVSAFEDAFGLPDSGYTGSGENSGSGDGKA